MSSPVLQIFGFCFIFFILYHFAPKAREYIFDFYAVIFVCLCLYLVFLSALALSAACGGTSPARVGGSPLRRFAPALPEGEPSLRPWAEENFVVRRSFYHFSLPQTLQRLTQVRLPPPRGGGGTALCAVTERGGSHACGGTNSDRVQRTKQGAVSGAALHFSQGHSCPRGKVAKRKRGWRAAHKGGETERATKKAPVSGRSRVCIIFVKKNNGQPGRVTPGWPAGSGCGCGGPASQGPGRSRRRWAR